MNYFKIILLFVFTNITNTLSAQSNIRYFGLDTLFHYHSNDIIETQNGNFLTVTDVSYFSLAIENYSVKKYLVRMDSNGDTIWTKYHNHDNLGGSNIIEAPNNTFRSIGIVGENFFCGGFGTWTPMPNHCTYHYSSTGNVLNYTLITNDCNEIFMDYKKSDTNGIVTLHSGDNSFATNFYSIKELLPNGQILSIPLVQQGMYFSQIEKNATGYWLLRSNILRRVDFTGDTIWQASVNFIQPTDLCKVNGDSLLVTHRGTVPNTFVLTKMDSLANIDWSKNY